MLGFVPVIKMNKDDLQARAVDLIESTKNANLTGPQMAEIVASTRSLLEMVYGRDSGHLEHFASELAKCRDRVARGYWDNIAFAVAKSHLKMVLTELDAELVGNLEATIAGEVLGDFAKLARQILIENEGDSGKNVAAVLAAALFEDTIRRLSASNGLPHNDSLESLIGDLKRLKVLQGAGVTIALGYLKFRNSSLHAQWNNVGRPDVEAVLAFSEGLLLKHFS